MRSIIMGIRSALFYIGYAMTSALFALLIIPLCAILPYHLRRHILLGWNRLVGIWLRISCGIRVVIEGAEHIPTAPYVVMCKHQSPWETIALQTLFAPISTILKRELLNIPGFGWGVRLMRPIAIDRGNPRQALAQLMEQGRARLAEGISVLIFPEGTRNDPGTVGNYARGGASLAKAAEVPVILVAHNAGECWPAHRFLKIPGQIRVVISEAIDTSDKTSREITEHARDWIETQVQRISRHR